MDEQKAVEYLDSLKKRAFMTMNEVDLANLVLKYKNELSKEIDKNRKAIEYIEDNMSYVVKGNKEYIPTGEDLLDILRGEE